MIVQSLVKHAAVVLHGLFEDLSRRETRFAGVKTGNIFLHIVSTKLQSALLSTSVYCMHIRS